MPHPAVTTSRIATNGGPVLVENPDEMPEFPEKTRLSAGLRFAHYGGISYLNWHTTGTQVRAPAVLELRLPQGRELCRPNRRATISLKHAVQRRLAARLKRECREMCEVVGEPKRLTRRIQ